MFPPPDSSSCNRRLRAARGLFIAAVVVALCGEPLPWIWVEMRGAGLEGGILNGYHLPILIRSFGALSFRQPWPLLMLHGCMVMVDAFKCALLFSAPWLAGFLRKIPPLLWIARGTAFLSMTGSIQLATIWPPGVYQAGLGLKIHVVACGLLFLGLCFLPVMRREHGVYSSAA
ncbi:MAG: hypothetical protein QM755_02170 [Luteolibacter sp.]